MGLSMSHYFKYFVKIFLKALVDSSLGDSAINSAYLIKCGGTKNGRKSKLSV